MKKFFSTLVAVLLVSGCSAHMNELNKSGGDNFSVLGLSDNTKFDFFKMHSEFGKTLKELNFTSEQKKSFKDIMQGSKKNFENNKNDRDEMKAKAKEIFSNDVFDKVNAKNLFDSISKKGDEHISQMSENIVKAYNILNAEQKKIIETKIDNLESKIEGFMDKKDHTEHFNKMKANLNLSAEQEVKLKALFESAKSERVAMFDNIKKVRKDVSSELKNGGNVDNIKQIITNLKNEHASKINEKIDKIAEFHDILTVEQRKKMISSLEDKKCFMGGKMKEHFHFWK